MKTCKTDGCEGKHMAKGYCVNCYRREIYYPKHRERLIKEGVEYHNFQYKNNPKFRKKKDECSKNYFRKIAPLIKFYRNERNKFIKNMNPDELISLVEGSDKS